MRRSGSRLFGSCLSASRRGGLEVLTPDGRVESLRRGSGSAALVRGVSSGRVVARRGSRRVGGGGSGALDLRGGSGLALRSDVSELGATMRRGSGGESGVPVETEVRSDAGRVVPCSTMVSGSAVVVECSDAAAGRRVALDVRDEGDSLLPFAGDAGNMSREITRAPTTNANAPSTASIIRNLMVSHGPLFGRERFLKSRRF